MRKPLILMSLVFFVFGLALTATPEVDASCNKKKQPGAEEQSDTFELPEVPKTTQPFRFDTPDPARNLRTVPYTIDPQGKTVILVGVSGRLSPERAQDVQEGILRLVQESMCRPDDVMVVWNADPIHRIATFRSGDRVQDCSPKWLKFKVANNQHEIAHLNQHFQKVREAKHEGIADLNLPRVVHFLGQEFHEYPEYPNRVLAIFGSAIHVARDGSGSSLHTAYPTVGMLRAPLSPFSTRDKSWYLGNTVTHFVHNEDFINEVHFRGLRNWWAAYFLSMGSPLLTFSPDTRVSERVLKSDLPGIPAYVDDVNPGFISVETTSLDDLFGPIEAGESAPSTVESGALVLGLKWDDLDVDLDLHVGLSGSTERLSFRNPRTDFGNLRKRFDTGWEEVRFNNEVAIRDVEVWANFYAGTAPLEGAQGELRVSLSGQLFRTRISFPEKARSGNEGVEGSPDHWVTIDVSAVVAGRN